MPTQAKSAHGVIVKIGVDTVAELRNASDVGFTSALVDVSSHDSGGWGVSIPTLKRGKQIPLEFNWVPTNAGHAALLAAALAGTSVPITITYNLAGVPEWTFNAFVADWGNPTLPVDNALMARCVLSPDEAMTFTL